MYLNILLKDKITRNSDSNIDYVSVDVIVIHLHKYSVNLLYNFLRSESELKCLVIIYKTGFLSFQDLKIVKWCHQHDDRVECIFYNDNYTFDIAISKYLKKFGSKSVVAGNVDIGNVCHSMGLFFFHVDNVGILNATKCNSIGCDLNMGFIAVNVTGSLPRYCSIRDAALSIWSAVMLYHTEGRVPAKKIGYSIFGDGLSNFTRVDKIEISSLIQRFFKKEIGESANFILWNDKQNNGISKVLQVNLSETYIYHYKVVEDVYSLITDPYDSLADLSNFPSLLSESNLNSDLLKIICLINKMSYVNFDPVKSKALWYAPDNLYNYLHSTLPYLFKRFNKFGIKVVKNAVNNKTYCSSLWNYVPNQNVHLTWMSSINLFLSWFSTNSDQYRMLLSLLPDEKEISYMFKRIVRSNENHDFHYKLPLGKHKRWQDILTPSKSEIDLSNLPQQFQKKELSLNLEDRKNVVYLSPSRKLRKNSSCEIVLKRFISPSDLYLVHRNIKVVIAKQFDDDIYREFVMRGILPLFYNLSNLSYDSSEIKDVQISLENVSCYMDNVNMKIFLQNGSSITVKPKLAFRSKEHFDYFTKI